tara:strand:+ start:191 stop:490 length:300 start_codon:yes stop_codon:yes gene_type:complete
MRTHLEVIRDLHTAKNKLAASDKLAKDTPKRSTAAICDAVRPSLVRRVSDLEAELATTPELPAERPASPVVDMPAYVPLTQEELEALYIPEFLKRTKDK